MSDATKTTTKRATRAKKAATGATSESVGTSATESKTKGQSEQELIIKAEEEAYAEAKEREEAEAKVKAEEQAKLEAEIKSEKRQQDNGQGDSNAGSDTNSDSELDVLSVLGAFKVCSKSDEGFWRSGVKFHRLQATLVLVVDKEIETPPAVDTKDLPAEFVVFMEKSKAQRVHSEPRLVVEDVELEDVLDIKDMAEL